MSTEFSKTSLAAGTVSESEIGTSYMPIFVGGVEAKLTKWLTIRAGASKSLLKTVTKVPPTPDKKIVTTTTYTAPFAYNMGLGVNVGSFRLDGLLNNNMPFLWSYIVSGTPTPAVPTQPFTQISLIYGF